MLFHHKCSWNFLKPLVKGSHYVDIAVDILVAVGFIGIGVNAPGTVLGLCIGLLVVAFGLKSIEGPCGGNCT